AIGNLADTLDDIRGPVTVNGQGGQTYVTVDDQGNDRPEKWEIAGDTVNRHGAYIFSNNVTMLTVRAGSGGNFFNLDTPAAQTPVSVYSGSGNDTFEFGDGDGVSGILDGQDGFDTIKYPLYSTLVEVDLQAGTATATGGIRNIED